MGSGAARGCAQRVVVDHAQWRAAIGHGATHAAQCVAHIPGLGAAVERCEAVQSIEVIRAGGGANLGLEHLTQWRSQVLCIPRGDAAGGLRHQRAVTVVRIRGRAANRRTVERIVGRRSGTVVGEIAGIVVGKAAVGDLVGGIVGGGGGRAAVELHRRAVAGQVIGGGVHAAGPLVRADQPCRPS